MAIFEEPRILQVLERGWMFRTDPNNVGTRESWQVAPPVDAWTPAVAGLTWQEQGFGEYKGVAWYRREFTNPAADPGNRTILFFDAVDGSVEVFLNGTKIGSRPLGPKGEGWDQAFYFDITDHMAAGKRSALALRVDKTEGVAGLTKSVKILSTTKIVPPR
jgi:beta-galactosidase/beta-glucuronidase